MAEKGHGAGEAFLGGSSIGGFLAWLTHALASALDGALVGAAAHHRALRRITAQVGCRSGLT
ncbi:hypothetical protein LGT39_06760 [Demequina sp. TTPB684]|uniref:hypothetical protein n=1 Tax=unclassified Demequina TaxID=2620311 RepID=UPI001CF362AD|nr:MULTISPECIES: hypothetical protein [unclassified Demequina]MCB2412549.1 hypothetical protein [Demequina sp. TTPB684]UPU87807.1 hypothetical protein LGT36_011170 [Demequina sp. TMPB413]